MTALRPGTSPPPVRIPMRFFAIAMPFRIGAQQIRALTPGIGESTPASPRQAHIFDNAPATLWFPSRFAIRPGEQRGQPEERRKLMRHHIGGNLRKIRAQPPLRFESLAKRT